MENTTNQIKNLIPLKERKNNFSLPYYANKNTITAFPTDITDFPYTRFYRGIYNMNEPIIFDREPGLSKKLFYKIQNKKEGLVTKPAPYFFEYPCSTVVPPQNIDPIGLPYGFRMSKGCVNVSI